MEYRRAWSPGGCFFFTVVTYKRQPILTIPENISRLRKAFAHVKHKRQFEIDWIVVFYPIIYILSGNYLKMMMILQQGGV